MNTRASQLPQSLIGHVLVAMPGMDDPRFARAVVLLCQHNEAGAMGLVVNRPSDYRLSEIFAQIQIHDFQFGVADRAVLSAGPVQAERGFWLHEGATGWDR